MMQDEHQVPSEKQGRKRGGRGNASSIDALAESAVRKMSSVEPPLQLAGQDLQFQAQREMVNRTNQCLQPLRALVARHDSCPESGAEILGADTSQFWTRQA